MVAVRQLIIFTAINTATQQTYLPVRTISWT